MTPTELSGKKGQALGLIAREYERITCRTVPRTVINDSESYIERGFEPEVIVRCIEITAEKGASWRYTLGILERLEAEEILTIDRWETELRFKKAMKKLKCRLIYDSHEICCETRYYDKYWLYNQYMKFTERRIVKRCDKMICVSNAAAEYFQNLYKIEKPLVITNCILQKNVLTDLPTKNEGFEVLNHGILHDSRGLEMMRDSCNFFRQYPDIKMAARGYGGIEHQLKEQVKNERLDNFLFYPPVDPTMLIPEAARSHVGVAVTLPVCLNFKLSVSNRLFEYAAAGLPVIMSDIPEHRYLNDKYQFGIVISNNEQKAFEEAVLRLYTDKALYEQCSRNARKMATEISWEMQFAPLIEYLSGIGSKK